jgi:glycosyltransferase involved in cell wall biosynthesis
MELLILTNNPNRASFRQRIEVYLDTLRENGINCEIATFPFGYLARWKLFRRARQFDGVFLHKKKLNLLDAFCLCKYSKKIIYNFDDAVMYSEKNPNRDSWSRLIPFRRTVKLADMVIASNSYLAEHAKKFNTKVEVLPTGLDIKAYKTDNKIESDGKIRLVWIGSKSTLRYLTEIKPALEEIGSRFENVILRIICDEFFELKNMPVEKRHWSLEAEAADLAASDIGLAPLPDNRFTRGKCGFKILQYASAGLSVVASPVGVNSEYVHDGVTGFLVTNLSQWSDRLARLIKNPTLRETMGAAGRKSVRNFDIAVIGKQLCILLKKVLQQDDSHNG